MLARSGLISPTLANMVLDGLEHRLADRIRQRKTTNGKVVYNPKINLIRYADDLVVTGDSPETLAKVKEVVVEFLVERGLELSPEKTRIVHLSEGFNFLGQNVRLYGDKVLIKPSKEALAKIYDKIRGIVRRNKSVEQRDLIRMLNPVLRGWVNYHPRRLVGRLSQTRLFGLEVTMAVGQAQASRQEPDVDRATLLARAGYADVDLRNHRPHRRQAENSLAGVRDGHPNPSSCQSTRGGQPLRTAMGGVPDGATHRVRSQLPARAEATLAPVANAGRALLGMRRTHHARDRLGGSSRSSSGGWGARSGTAIFGCCTRTAIGNIMPMKAVRSRVRASGLMQRLELDAGKLARPVLRGRDGSNAAPLPDQALETKARFIGQVITGDNTARRAVRQPFHRHRFDRRTYREMGMSHHYQ